MNKSSEAVLQLTKGYPGLTDENNSEVCNANEDYMNLGRDIIQDGLTDIVRLYRSYDQPAKADKLEAELNRRLKAWGREPTSSE